MTKTDIIVIGASAGGVPALMTLVASIPADFNGSIFVVLHIPPHSPSNLPSILSNAGHLPAKHPSSRELVKPGIIYIAPPDHHLLLDGKYVVTTKGPKENRFRPSVDALFRSAAYVYGARVVGIILSGVLNDGTSGMWSVNRLGGTTIIQEPEDAEHPEMPLNVLEYVEVHHTLRATEIGAMIQRLSLSHAPKKVKITKKEAALLELELSIAIHDNAFEMGIMQMGELTPFTCPECNGVLIQLLEGKIIRFRCHTGHAYTASTLLGDLTESIESKLWECMKGIEETTMVLNRISQHFKKTGHQKAASLFLRKADENRRRAQIVHDSIFNFEILSEDSRYPEKKAKQPSLAKTTRPRGKLIAGKRKPLSAG